MFSHQFQFTSRTLLGCVALLVSLTPIRAAVAEDIHVYGGLSSAKAILDDMELIVGDLAGKPVVYEEKIFPNIDIFLIGVDPANAIRFDSILGEDGNRRLNLVIAVSDFKDFQRDNLEPIGISYRRDKKDKALYELSGEVYEGALRALPAKKTEYVIIAPAGYEDDVEIDLADVKATNASLFADTFDAAVLVDETSGAMEGRAATIAKMRDAALENLSKRPEETASAFALRTQLIKNRYDRLESLLVGGKRLFAGYETVNENKTGRLKFVAEALPETVLAKAIDGIGQTTSKFVNVPTIDDPVATARMSIPLYEERRERMTATIEASRQMSIERVTTSDDSDELKTARQTLLNLVYDQIIAGIAQDQFSGFYEVREADSGHSVAAGITTVDGQNVEAILDAFPPAIEKASLTKNVDTISSDTVGEITIHKVSVPELAAPLKKHLGGVTDAYIGVADDAVYFAGGPDGLDLLKSLLEDVEPATTDTALSLRMHAAPMAELLDEVMTKRDFSLIEFLQDRRSERLEASDRDPDDVRRLQNIDPTEWRKAAIEALVGKPDDVVTLEVKKVDGRLEGDGTFGTAILTAAGELIAKFADENF